MAVSSSSLAVTLAHAVSYLTRPLNTSYSSATILKLQAALEANLAAVLVATWNPLEPLRGSGRRCLTFSPHCLPPRPVYNACVAAQVQWADWSRLLGDIEFDLFIDPGCVSMRIGQTGSGSFSKLITVWSEELEAQAQAKFQAEAMYQAQYQPSKPAKTLAQRLIEEDEEDGEDIFAMIANEMHEPTWMTPMIEKFPIVPSSSSRSSLGHSRSSSRSSIMSGSDFSFSSEESLTSCGSQTSVSSHASSGSLSSSNSGSAHSGDVAKKQSRRERARQARVYVDTSKNEVTPYDGGKTTVLTGGVMLGGPPAGARKSRRN